MGMVNLWAVSAALLTDRLLHPSETKSKEELKI